MKRFMYLLFFVLLAGVTYAQQAKYVFYFIGDGMGVNQVNGTEMYLAEQEGRIGVTPLLFTQFPAVGVATTFSATNSVTDSSAAGTALATGVKTYNGAIGMDDQNIEALKRAAINEEERAKIFKMTDFCRKSTSYSEIPDPYYEGPQGFELVLDLLEDAVAGLYWYCLAHY